MISENQKNIIKKILLPIHPNMIGIFGSFARSENKADSDIDILIDAGDKINLLDLIGLEQELSAALNRKIDLITLRSLNEKIKPFILRDLILI